MFASRVPYLFTLLLHLIMKEPDVLQRDGHLAREYFQQVHMIVVVQLVAQVVLKVHHSLYKMILSDLMVAKRRIKGE